MNECKWGKPRLPIGEVAPGMICGAVMLDGAIVEIALGQLSKGMHLIVLIELEFSEFDLPFNSMRPIVSLLFAFEVIAESGVALDSDDRTPNRGVVIVLAFEYRC
jgi:hypothetical protein